MGSRFKKQSACTCVYKLCFSLQRSSFLAITNQDAEGFATHGLVS
jgi:hypothetical protein